MKIATPIIALFLGSSRACARAIRNPDTYRRGTATNGAWRHSDISAWHQRWAEVERVRRGSELTNASSYAARSEASSHTSQRPAAKVQDLAKSAGIAIAIPAGVAHKLT